MKDDSTGATDRCFKLYYYSHETVSGEELFGGLRPTNLYRNAVDRDILSKYVQLMTRFNVYLELGIRRKVYEQ